MTINPFLEYPFWHYFTLHMQNVMLMNDSFRRINPGDRPVAMSTLLQSTSYDELINVIMGSKYYDFINDAIISIDNSMRDKIYIVTPRSLNPTTISSIPEDSLVVVKGLINPTTGSGGELMPMIASPRNMWLIFEALPSAQAIARGETTTRDGNPIKRYDFMAALTQEERDRLESLLDRSIYKNITIATILRSYKRQGSSASDMDRTISRIKNQLKRTIPEEKAINAVTGSLVTATGHCYNVQELQVLSPGTTDYKTVKFAFKTALSEDDRTIYEQMLRDVFNARPVQTTEISIDQRRSITLQPIRATFNEYDNIFRSNEGFHAYIQKINDITASQSIDTSYILHNVADEDEPDLDELDDDDVDDIDNL